MMLEADHILAMVDPAIEAEVARLRERPFSKYYRNRSDREGYAKHCAFFAAGSTFRERALLGGNRCLTRWTAIQTDRGERQIAEMIGAGAFAVRSWDGSSLCTKPASPVFRKGIEPAFHVVLDSGEAFQCSGRHLVLCSDWSGERHLSGWVSIYQIIHDAGVLRCWRTPQGWMASCGEDDHHGDGPLLLVPDSEIARSPSLLDAPSIDQGGWLVDVEASTGGRIRACLSPSRQPTVDDLIQDGVRSGVCEGESALLGVLPSGSTLRAVRQYDSVYGLHRVGFAAEVLRLARPESAFVPLRSPMLYGGNRIVAVIPIGYKEIWDLTVEDTHNYFAAGVVHHNSGKSVAGAYELTAHLTGRYPPWWQGRRFTAPVKAWVAGDTSKTVRDINQEKLIGPSGQPDLGMIPLEYIEHKVAHRGLADTVETLWVRHVSGANSVLNFKSYDQRREAFQGTAQEVIWLDEEPPEDIYGECIARTMTTDGVIMLTFTPLKGLSEVVLKYLPDGRLENCPDNKFAIMVSWDEAPHLDEKAKAEVASAYPKYQLEARRSGIPQLGSGLIYTVAESEIVVDPFQIPKHWPRVFAVDVGWNNTAAVWLAIDRATETAYIYDTYKRGGVEPAAHEAAIAGRGAWIPGVIDPAAIWRSVAGRSLTLAENDVEPGIDRVYRMLAAGRLKLFRSASTAWLGEYRVYRRDDKGRIVKEHDHLLDATRYAVMSGLQLAKVEPEPKAAEPARPYHPGERSLGWMS